MSSGEAEHRHVTVAFLKLAGTDELLGEHGSEGFLERLDEIGAAVERACETYGVTWLESDIDIGAVKLYLTAGAPSSTGDDEEGMLRAVREIIDGCPRSRSAPACTAASSSPATSGLRAGAPTRSWGTRSISPRG